MLNHPLCCDGFCVTTVLLKCHACYRGRLTQTSALKIVKSEELCLFLLYSAEELFMTGTHK